MKNLIYFYKKTIGRVSWIVFIGLFCAISAVIYYRENTPKSNIYGAEETYTDLAIVTVSYQLNNPPAGTYTDSCPVHYPNSKYPSTYINTVDYCGTQMSRIGGYCGISQYQNQAVEMWYLLTTNNTCTTPTIAFANGSYVGNWRVSSNKIHNVPTVNFIDAYNRAGTTSNQILLTKTGPIGSVFACGYSSFPNSGANSITPIYPTDLTWEQMGSKGFNSTYPNVQTGIGVSYPRGTSGQTSQIQWNATQSQPWAAFCANINLKPQPTPAPVPPYVNLKINGSDGPITVNAGTTLSATWTSTYTTSCIGTWGGGTVVPTNGTTTIPNNFTGSQTFTISCLGADTNNPATDSVTVIINSPSPSPTPNPRTHTVDIKINGLDNNVFFNENDTVTATWTSVGADTCEASAFGLFGEYGNVATSGTILLPLGSSLGTTVSVFCKGQWGMASDSVSLTRGDRIIDNSVYLIANAAKGPITIPAGSYVVLTWETVHNTSSSFSTCTASGDWSGTKATSGTLAIPNVTAGNKKYKLECTYNNGGGNYTTSAEVYVNLESTTATPPQAVKSGDRGWLERFYKSIPTGTLSDVNIFNDLKISRLNTGVINYDWGSTSSPDHNLLGDDYYAGRWTAQMVPWKTGQYDFVITMDDGARLKVGNTYVINDWALGGRRVALGSINLIAGRPYDVTQEFFEQSGGSVMISNVGYSGDYGPASVYLVANNNGISP